MHSCQNQYCNTELLLQNTELLHATEYRITATEYRITAIESRITAYAVCIHLEIVRNSEKYLLGLTPVARRNNILISPFSKYV